MNAALAGTSIAQAGTITIKVVYDVASNKGGVNTVYTLTAASRRTPATSGNAASSITPGQTYAVAVTPDGGQNVQKLPGNNYSFTFTAQNNGNGSDNFDLLASSPGSAVITIVSVNGVAGDSARFTLAAGASQAFAVIYNVANVAGGSTDTLNLLGRSVGQPATTNNGFMDLTVIKPNLTLAKAAYLDDGVTPVSRHGDPRTGHPVPDHSNQRRIHVRFECAGDRCVAGAGDVRLHQLVHRLECRGGRAERDGGLHGHRWCAGRGR